MPQNWDAPRSSLKQIIVPFQAQGQSHDVLVDVPNTGAPDEELKAEATEYLETLAANGQLEVEDHPRGSPLRATHTLSRNPDGTRTLKRLRYSAL